MTTTIFQYHLMCLVVGLSQPVDGKQKLMVCSLAQWASTIHVHTYHAVGAGEALPHELHVTIQWCMRVVTHRVTGFELSMDPMHNACYMYIVMSLFSWNHHL